MKILVYDCTMDPQYNGSQWGPPTVWLPVIVFIFCVNSKHKRTEAASAGLRKTEATAAGQRRKTEAASAGPRKA